MNYKITLYNSKFYREIKLDNKTSKGLLIGTGKDCQVRFFQEQFSTDFSLKVTQQDGKYIINCKDNVYLKKANTDKQYTMELFPLDVVGVCYDSSGIELFKIEFLIDFDVKNGDYDRQILIEGNPVLTIGGRMDCMIRLNDNILRTDYIVASRTEGGYTINQENMRYNIMVNGCQIRQKYVGIKNQDFFTLNGYSFYLKDGALYTSKAFNIQTNLGNAVILRQNNKLNYPCFVKSARQQFEIPNEKLEILPPKSKQDEPKKNLIATMIPMLMSMGMMMAMRMMMGRNAKYAILCGGMGLVSILMAVYNYRNEGIEYRKKMVKRENDYNRYIAEQEEKIRFIREKEQVISARKYPSIEEHIKFVEDFDARLFEKQKDHDDYLSLRIGQGTVESKNQLGFKQQEYREVDDPFMDYPEKIHDKYRYLENMPVILDLKDKAAVGFIGDRTHLYQMAKNLILLISIEHYYLDMKTFLIMNEGDMPMFTWARWLKNMSENNIIRNFAYDEASNKVVLEYLYSELCNREKMNEKDISQLPNIIVLVYRSEIIGNHPVSKYVEKAAQMGFTFIFFEEYAELLNQYCEKRIFLDNNQNKGYIQDIRNGEDLQRFEYTHIPGTKAAQTALKLGCVYVDEVSLEASLTKNISLYELLGIMNAYELEIEKRWATSKVYETMAAPLGVKSGGETVYLDLHEKYHGPHGLVAGTTGSGKSEILQSYILSMATLFHPYEVGFIIIDFKGGGMVNQFRNLPHLNGAITNIDDGEIERSLSSIKAELKKRQRLFAEQDVNHIDDYIKLYKQGVAKTPLPHLILIVDEFAELKSEQPEFMKELISTARIGRSLGVHLILATQKPAGVVNDQIWSNSKFKLCLKVQNKNDSNEVLKSPLAAEIREPGRAYLQVGNNEIFQLFQSAYSGAPIPNTALENRKAFKLSKVNLYGAREVIFEQKKQVDDNSISQLDAIVDYISEYCGKKHIERLPNLCLPALEENIPYGLLRYTNESKDICVPIGVYDDPENQYQGVMDVNFSQGNIFVIGSSQMGKTNMLQTMIRGIAERYTSDEVHLYILDFASMILKNFESLKHVGGVIVSTDEEKLSAFFKMMQQELVRRRDILSNLGLSSYSAYRDSGKTDMPQIIIMIDNVNAFRELYYSMEDKLTKLVREGSTVGICIVITTRQSSGLGYKYLSNFPKRFALYCNDSGEYTSVIEKCRKSLKPIAGRCLLTIEKDIYYGQIYLAYPAEKEIERVKEIHDFINKINNKDNGSCAVRIPVMPSVVNADTIRNILHEDLKPYRIPVGVNYDNLDVDVMNLKQFQMLGIGGDDNNGRESYVKYIIKTLIDNNENAPINIHLIDDNRKALEKFSKTVATYSTDSNKVIDIVQEVYSVVEKRKENFAEDAPMECIIINNAESYDVLSENKDMLELCRKLLTEYAQYKISIILTNVPNINLTFKNSPFLNFLSSASNLILFYQLEQQKLVPLPREATAKYKEKPLMQGDAYFKCGDYLGKYKMPV